MLRRLKKEERGSVLVEFAMVIPILLLIIWAIIDFARAYYTVNSLASAVREGARVAAVYKSPEDNVAAIKTRVKDAFNAFGGPPLTDDQIHVIDDSQATGSVTVEVRDYQWLTTTPINVFSGGQVLMTRRATFRWEREPT